MLLPHIRQEHFGKEALDLFQDAAEFQLQLWKYYISGYMNVSVVCDFDTEISWMKTYMHKIQKWETIHV